MQQDAHEFFNYTLNAIAEILIKQKSVVAEKLKELNLPKILKSNDSKFTYSLFITSAIPTTISTTRNVIYTILLGSCLV